MAKGTSQGEQAIGGGLRPDTLVGSVLVMLAVNVVQRSIGFGRGILVCRWLDPENLGQWEMAYGFLLLAAPLAVLGLPGSFGRYLERFRQRGQLRTFLTRTATWTFSLAALAVLSIAWLRTDFAWLVFGDAARDGMTLLLAATLGTVIAHHFLEAVFAGLRLFRIVSVMHFVQSMCFAVLSLTLVAWWRAESVSVILAYGLACLISVCGISLWSWRSFDFATSDVAQVSHREFWPPLVRFAIWVWVTNLLSNLFAVIDRYMIVHFSGLAPDEAIAEVANYHTSMIIPVLMVSVANLLVGAVTPHLSHDWELGARERVSFQLNFLLKAMLVGMTLVGFVVLTVAPQLFHFAFGDKYNGGLAVLPWAVASCVWFSLLLVSQTFAWIAEQTRRAAWPLALGIVVNVVLNLILLPAWGLIGAIVATAMATLLAFVTQLITNRQLGMQLRPGTLVLTGLPIVLTMPPTSATLATALFAVLLCGPGLVIARDEWAAVRNFFGNTLAQITSRLATRHG